MEGIFWKDDFEGEGKGGLLFRAFDLIKFLDKIETNNDEVVGIKFDDSNNIELIIEEKEDE